MNAMLKLGFLAVLGMVLAAPMAAADQCKYLDDCASEVITDCESPASTECNGALEHMGEAAVYWGLYEVYWAECTVYDAIFVPPCPIDPPCEPGEECPNIIRK